MRIVAVQVGQGAEALGKSLRQGVRPAAGPGNLGPAIHPIGIAHQGMDARVAPGGQGKGQQAFHIAPAQARRLRGAAQGDGGFAATEQHTRRLKGLAALGHLQGQGGQHLAHIAGLALDGIAQDVAGNTVLLRHPGGRFQGLLGRGNEVGAGSGQARVVRLDGFARAAFQCGQHLGRQLQAIALHDGQRIRAGAGIAHGGAGGNVGRVVAGHIRQQQGDDAGRVAGSGQAATFDGRKVAAHGVHLANAGPAGQQGAVDGLLVLQGDARQRQRQQGRAAARNQRQHHIVRRQALGQGQHALGGVQPGGIGHRVGGLHHFNALARHLVAVAGDDQAT